MNRAVIGAVAVASAGLAASACSSAHATPPSEQQCRQQHPNSGGLCGGPGLTTSTWDHATCQATWQ
jgi:hypothetical protein